MSPRVCALTPAGHLAARWGDKYVDKPPLGPLAWNVDSGVAHSHRLVKAFDFDGRAIEVPYRGDLISMRGGEQGQEYFLRSVVLHTPSEHTFDGVHYPMEAQFIHASPGRAPGAWLGGRWTRRVYRTRREAPARTRARERTSSRHHSGIGVCKRE